MPIQYFQLVERTTIVIRREFIPNYFNIRRIDSMKFQSIDEVFFLSCILCTHQPPENASISLENSSKIIHRNKYVGTCERNAQH